MKIPVSFKAPLGSKVVVGLPELCSCKRRNGAAEKKVVRVSVKATVERSGGGGGGDGGIGGGDRKSGGLMEVTTFSQGFGEAEFPVWDKIGAIVRLSYGVGKFYFVLFHFKHCNNLFHIGIR